MLQYNMETINTIIDFNSSPLSNNTSSVVKVSVKLWDWRWWKENPPDAIFENTTNRYSTENEMKKYMDKPC